MKLNLSYFGEKKVFSKPKSTSNLVKPDVENYKKYIKNSLNNKNEFYLKELFQEKFSELHGTKYCIPVVNGLWALVVAIRLLKIEGKTEVIIPSFTYRRMADIAAWLGLTPRFCDVDVNTFSLTKENIEAHINDETAIIIAPHSIVNVCDVYGIEELSSSKGIQ